MRSAIVAYLLTIPMLLHGLFGCCWHHDRCELPAVQNVVHAAPIAAHHGCCHRHHSVADQDDDRESPLDSDSKSTPDRHAPHHCPGSQCDYVSSIRVRTADPGLVAAEFDLAIVSNDAQIQSGVTLIGPVHRNLSKWSPTGTLRPHALHCVWLI